MTTPKKTKKVRELKSIGTPGAGARQKSILKVQRYAMQLFRTFAVRGDL
jgi:hypothetical protein